MKLLYPLIILFAFSFADDTGVLFFSPDESINIVFEKIEDGKVQYHTKTKGATTYTSIEVDSVYSLILDDGTEIISPKNSFPEVTIIYRKQYATGLEQIKQEGRYLGTMNNAVYIKNKFDVIKIFKCDTIVGMYDKKNEIFQYDCSIDTYKPIVLTELNAPKQSRGRLGGLLIAVGGGFLYSNIDKEINDDETIEDFVDRVNGTAKLGCGLIIIGGLLVAVGI